MPKTIFTFVILGIGMLGLLFLAAAIYAYQRPDSALGQEVLIWRYDGSADYLQAVDQQLTDTNGGHIPPGFNAMLRERFATSQQQSEKDAILLFFAAAAQLSRQGEEICQIDDGAIMDLTRLAREDRSTEQKQGLLLLALCLHYNRELYKPGLDPSDDVDALWDQVADGQIAQIKFFEP